MTIDITLKSTLTGKEVMARATTPNNQWCAEITGRDGDDFERAVVFEQRGIEDPEATSKFQGGSRIGVSDGDVFELVPNTMEDERTYLRVEGDDLVEIDPEDI